MKAGEKVVFGGVAALIVGAVLWAALKGGHVEHDDMAVPFFSTAPAEVQRQAGELIRALNCRDCHALWTVRSALQAVPAPPLDGMGSLKSEEWLYQYFSAERPQDILPSRLKAEYRMPSYAYLPEAERRLLAGYIASLKVEDWYLDEVKKLEREKLFGVSPQAALGGETP